MINHITNSLWGVKFDEKMVDMLSTASSVEIERYCNERAYKLAVKIDDSLKVLIKPKPRWCPNWLYRKIIKESVLLVHTCK